MTLDTHYKCEFCGQHYKLPRNLQYHLANNHPAQLLQEELKRSPQAPLPIQVDPAHEHWLHMSQGFKTTCHRPAKPYRRLIHLTEEIWSYRITDGVIIIRNPEGTKTTKIPFEDFTGWSNEALERAQWKDTQQPQIEPSDIKLFIQYFLR